MHQEHVQAGPIAHRVCTTPFLWSEPKVHRSLLCGPCTAEPAVDRDLGPVLELMENFDYK